MLRQVVDSLRTLEHVVHISFIASVCSAEGWMSQPRWIYYSHSVNVTNAISNCWMSPGVLGWLLTPRSNIDVYIPTVNIPNICSLTLNHAQREPYKSLRMESARQTTEGRLADYYRPLVASDQLHLVLFNRLRGFHIDFFFCLPSKPNTNNIKAGV